MFIWFQILLLLLQVLFLMYHYFAASEIYNAIRVFIAAYVWMTGFGNFSYYYIRKDFSIARFAQVTEIMTQLIISCFFASYSTLWDLYTFLNSSHLFETKLVHCNELLWWTHFLLLVIFQQNIRMYLLIIFNYCWSLEAWL